MIEQGLSCNISILVHKIVSIIKVFQVAAQCKENLTLYLPDEKTILCKLNKKCSTKD